MQIWGIVEVSKMFKISESIVSRIQRETERGVKINECLNKLLIKYELQSDPLGLTACAETASVVASGVIVKSCV